MDPAAPSSGGGGPPHPHSQHSQQHTAAAQPLPKCFCNWKNCRTYQKALREYKHTLYNGVIKLKFVKGDRKSMALKAAVDRTLHVDSSKRNEWKTVEMQPHEQQEQTDHQQPTSSVQCRYYVARHHFTEALMKQYLADRRAWDWNDPLTMKQAKTFLWSLDRQDVYVSEEDQAAADDDEGDEDDTNDTPTRYVQAPNVPKEQVREMLKKLKEQHKINKSTGGNGTSGAGTGAGGLSPKAANAGNGKKGNNAGAGAGASVHTQSTLSTSVTDTLKAFEDIIGHQEVNGKDSALVEKEQENTQLRAELNECQEQLSMLHTMVKQLKVDMDRTSAPAGAGSGAAGPTTAAAAPAPAPAPPNSSSNMKKGSKKKDVHNTQADVSSSEEEESSSEEEDDDDDDEDDEDDEWSRDRQEASDDDETISTFHVNSYGNRSQFRSGGIGGSRHAVVRKNSVHSVHSRRNSVHSRRNSVHSRSRHSMRRDSVHSRRSMRGGGGMDDAASVVSRQSLQSVSPSIKSLPREIELMDEEDTQGKDDYSFFDDSYRKPDDDARSVGSRSAASRASRRSMVSGTRSRGRNSRRPGQQQQQQQQQAPANPTGGAPPAPPASGAGGKKNRTSRSGAVPREIDLSGDELEDATYDNVSTDTLFVTDKQIVDPYGEKGVYTGALSKSTGMPNGKGRLEYEKEGRWYEGDWIHGRWTGYGRLSNGDGDFYEGGLKNDHKHGTGIMRFADGRVFEGEYIRGQMIQGKMTYQDGSVYGGSWVDGMRHGRGKCIFVDGSEYEGEFREGNFHGHGKMTWNDGGWYVGEWCDGEMHGKGKEIRPDGTLRHDGEWSRGQPIRAQGDSRRRRNQNPTQVEAS